MSPFAVGNLFLAGSIFASSAGQVAIKKAFAHIPSEMPAAEATERLGPAIVAGVLIVSGFICWLLSLQRLPLSYAYPMACSSALAVAGLSSLVLGEVVTWRLWIGTLLISLGAALVVVQNEAVR
jgi:drug/metabolite transporter (DMT)-like permease